VLNEDVANCNPSITAFEALNEAVAVLTDDVCVFVEEVNAFKLDVAFSIESNLLNELVNAGLN
jgi:hypothetical protein